MTREEILREIDEAIEKLTSAKKKSNDALCHARNIVAKDDVAAYNKGLEDAWKLAKKISHYTAEGLLDRFETTDIMCVFDEYTPQEALAKLEAYEKAQAEIKVGDVVTIFPRSGGQYNAIVVYLKCEKYIDAIYSDGITTNNVPPELYKKTGKHIDISSILEQIKEN